MMGWFVYLTGLALCLGVAWLWFPRNRWWHYFLITVGIALAVPWSTLPSGSGSDWAPAAIIALFSLAFEPGTVREALRIMGIWAGLFAGGVAAVQAGLFWRRRKRRTAEQAAQTSNEQQDADGQAADETAAT